MLSIFTPTYDRAFILPKLYESLREQTANDFEWVVADDGSTDGTEALVRRWQQEGAPFPIVFLRQANGGKHRAINAGVRVARGDFFYIVDSDDRLPRDAVERLLEECARAADDPDCAGVVGLRGHFDGTPLGSLPSAVPFDGHIRTLRYRRGVMADMAEVVRTDLLRRFPFPEIEGERFCTEALVWNRLDRRYHFRFLPRVVYLCEYLEGGLSAGYMRLLHRSPVGAALYYSELAHDGDLPLRARLRSIVSLWRYCDLVPPAWRERLRVRPLWRLLRPAGRYFLHRDRVKYDSL